MTKTETPVQKSITVKAGVEHTFAVFTEACDTWWPRSHHIGKSPMKKAVMEGHAGGRWYAAQEDGTDCDWGRVLVWEPPQRLVLVWQISPIWEYEPDPAKSSEVEVRFTPLGDGTTRVDLEHRCFGRHGEGWEGMRTAIDSEGGWSGLLQAFQTQVERA